MKKQVFLLVAVVLVSAGGCSDPVDRGSYACREQGPALFPIHVGGKTGYIDKGGKVVIRPVFWSAGDFSCGRAGVALAEGDSLRWGYIDKTGRFVIDLGQRVGQSFSEGLAGVWSHDKKGKHYVYIDVTGEEVFSCREGEGGNFSEGLAEIRIDGKSGYMDYNGRIVIRPIYDWTSPFHGGFAVVRQRGMTWYIDKKGRKPFEVDADGVFGFSEGRAIIERKGLYGYIDATGSVIVEPKYSWADSYHEGVAAVRVGGVVEGKMIYLNLEGQRVMGREFEVAGRFSEGLAFVGSKSENGKITKECIDHTGRRVFECPLQEKAYYHAFKNGLAAVWVGEQNNFRIGYINRKGNWVWKPTK